MDEDLERTKAAVRDLSKATAELAEALAQEMLVAGETGSRPATYGAAVKLQTVGNAIAERL
jgi:hypothetical protein